MFLGNPGRFFCWGRTGHLTRKLYKKDPEPALNETHVLVRDMDTLLYWNTGGGKISVSFPDFFIVRKRSHPDSFLFNDRETALPVRTGFEDIYDIF
jgi:hypothetical protein